MKVLDFGLAKSLAPRAVSAAMTSAGAVLGTPAYMAPEFVTGGECDARADLYALGCVLYLAASGAPPFAASTVHQLIALHATEPPAPLRDVPRELARMIERLLAKEPLERFQTAAETRAALDAPARPDTDTDTATPTLLSGGPSTMLGWTNPQMQTSRRISATPVPARSSPPVIASPPPDEGDEGELRTSTPALFLSDGVAPRTQPAPVVRRRLLPLLIVAALVLTAALVAVVR